MEPTIYEDIVDLDPDNDEPIEEESLMADIEDFKSPDAYDQYISASVMLPKYDGFVRAKLKGWKRDPDDNLLGARHSNPFLDTHVYEVKFQDGATNEYATNITVENLYSKTDPQGNEFMILKDIIIHRSTDKAVPLSGAYEGDHKIQKHNRTTAGWELMVEWADKTQPQTWIALKDLK